MKKVSISFFSEDMRRDLSAGKRQVFLGGGGEDSNPNKQGKDLDSLPDSINQEMRETELPFSSKSLLFPGVYGLLSLYTYAYS